MNCNEQTCASCREAGTPMPGILSRLARGLVLKSLSTVTHGRIIIVENEERLEFGDPQSKLVAAVRVRHPEFYRRYHKFPGIRSGNKSIEYLCPAKRGYHAYGAVGGI